MKFKFNTYLLTRLLIIGGLVSTLAACGSDNDEPIITPTPPVANTAPSITSTSVDNVEEGSAYSYTFTATDAEGDALTYSATTLPTWLAFDAATGALTGTPTTADVGDYTVTLEVTDSQLSDSETFTITVSALPVVNTPPTITSDAVVTGTVGVAYSYMLTATDVDNDDTLDLSSVTLPTWGDFDASTGILSGIPDMADSYDVELMVSDGTDAVSQTFTIVISAAAPDAPSVELVIFENMALAKWALWDCCAGSTPSVETDDVDHDQVAEFDVLGAAETVQGFTARDADGAIGGTPFDASAFSSTGTLSFEMKVVTAPAAGTPWILKLESVGAATNTGDLNLNSSNEGAEPVVGQWQTYTFNLSALAAAGLDLSAIDVVMIFPAWGQGAGAVYRVDNVMVLNAAGMPDPDPEPAAVVLSVFENMALAEWALWDCCAGSTPSVETDDDDHDQVAEFDVLGAAETVQGFTARDADGAVGGTPFNASAYASTGTLSFEMKVVTAPAAGTPWILKLESVGAATNTGDLNLNSSNEGAEPVVGQWQTYTFSLSALAAAGLDLSAIDVIMVFPAWGQGAGAVYRVDNVMIVNAAGMPDPDPEPNPVPTNKVLTVFENMALGEWALWDCCAGSTPSVETDDVDHDQVAEFDVLGAAETVQGFTAREADGAIGGTPFDASAFSSTGTLSFEMKVVTAPAAGTPWILKLESVGAATNTGDLNLNSSNEGAEPVVGQWQTYTFNLSALAAAGLDLSAIDLVMIFPAWGQGAGAVYRVDNLYVYSDGAGAGNNEAGGNRVVGITDIGNYGFVSNGGFESGDLDSWLAEGAGDISAMQDDMDTWLAKIVAAEAQNPSIKQSKIGEGVITNGQALTVSFDMKGTAGPGGVVNALLFTEASTGVSKTDNLMTVVPTEEWQNYSFDVTAGDNTEWGVTLLLQPVCGAVEGCQVTAYFDNVSITTQ